MDSFGYVFQIKRKELFRIEAKLKKINQLIFMHTPLNKTKDRKGHNTWLTVLDFPHP